MVDGDEARSDELRGYRDAREDDKSGSDEVNRKSKLLLLIEAT
jgi:hypothetical protein